MLKKSFLIFLLILIINWDSTVQARNYNVNCIYEQDPINPYKILDEDTLLHINKTFKVFISWKSLNQKIFIRNLLQQRQETLWELRVENLKQIYWHWHRIFVSCESDPYAFLSTEQNKKSFLIWDFLLQLTNIYIDIASSANYDMNIKAKTWENIWDIISFSWKYSQFPERVMQRFNKIKSWWSPIHSDLFIHMISLDVDDLTQKLRAWKSWDIIKQELYINNSRLEWVDILNHWLVRTKKLSETYFYDEYNHVKTFIWRKVQSARSTSSEPREYWQILLDNFSIWSRNSTRNALISNENMDNSVTEKLASDDNLNHFFYLLPWNGSIVSIIEVDHLQDTVTFVSDYTFLRERSYFLDNDALIAQIEISAHWVDALDCPNILRTYRNKIYVWGNNLDKQVQLNICTLINN